MYRVGPHDQILSLQKIPPSSIGAPAPMILADEHKLVVVYYTQSEASIYETGPARLTDPNETADEVALVTFHQCYAKMFGPPNEEAFHGHPLSQRGLEPFGSYEIKCSSWIRELSEMNSVHPHHRPEFFEKLRHFILSFHDSTLECAAQEFSVVEKQGPLIQLVADLVWVFGNQE